MASTTPTPTMGKVEDDFCVFQESTNMLNSVTMDADTNINDTLQNTNETEKQTPPVSFSPQLAYLHTAQAMKNEIIVKDRISHLTTYKDCFLGSDAVGFLQRYLKLKSREQAVEVANDMNEYIDCWEQINGDTVLKDQPLFYRFIGDFRNPKDQNQNLASKAAVLFEASMVDHSDSTWDCGSGERAGSFRFGALGIKEEGLNQMSKGDDSWGAFDINNVLATTSEGNKTRQGDGNFDPFQQSRVLDGVADLFEPNAFPAKETISRENGQRQELTAAAATECTRSPNAEGDQGDQGAMATETITPRRRLCNSLDSSRRNDESPAANRATHSRSFSPIPRLPGSTRDLCKAQKSARDIYKEQKSARDLYRGQKLGRSRSKRALPSKPGPLLHRSRSAGVAGGNKPRESEGGPLSKPPGLVRRSRTTGNESPAKSPAQDGKVKRSTKTRKAGDRKPRGRSPAKPTGQSKSRGDQMKSSASHTKSRSLSKPRDEPKAGADQFTSSSNHEKWRSLSQPRDVAPSKRPQTLERVSWRRNESRSKSRTASISPDDQEGTRGKCRSNSSRILKKKRSKSPLQPADELSNTSEAAKKGDDSQRAKPKSRGGSPNRSSDEEGLPGDLLQKAKERSSRCLALQHRADSMKFRRFQDIELPSVTSSAVDEHQTVESGPCINKRKPVDILSIDADELDQPGPLSSKCKTLASKAG